VAELPPMLRAPSTDQLKRAAQREGLLKRRDTLARKTEYRKALLRTLANRLEHPSDLLALPSPSFYGLTEDQAASVRRVFAQVLRNREQHHEGRLRV
jgi:hypothetical protein